MEYYFNSNKTKNYNNYYAQQTNKTSKRKLTNIITNIAFIVQNAVMETQLLSLENFLFLKF